MVQKFRIEKATRESDFEAIRNVYYRTWITSYKGIVSQKFLDSIKKEVLWHPEKRWQSTFVAMSDNNEIIGVCSYGPARKKSYKGFGEVYSIYVLPEWQRTGVGKALFLAALEILEANYKKLYLLVLKNNLSAQKFYQSFGFEKTTDIYHDGIFEEITFVKW